MNYEPTQSMSPGGKLKSNGWRKFVKKMGYGHEINSNHLLESFRRADHVPIPPGDRCYAAVDRTTPPEPGDTAD